MEPHPDLLREEDQLTAMVNDVTAHSPADAGVQFVNQVFTDLLPRTAPLIRLQDRLLSELHMRFVFSPEAGGEDKIDAHLWRGVRTNPTWLLNRGVLARLARSVMRPGKSSSSSKSDRHRH